MALGAAIQTQLEEETYIEYTRSDVAAKEEINGKWPFKRKKNSDSTAQEMSISARFFRPVQQARAIDNLMLLRKRDVQAHGMGIITINAEGTAYINENIIPPNMPIPVKSAQSFRYFTSSKHENELEIFVVEGEGAPLTCQINAKYVASGIRHIKGGETLLRVQYSFDKNSVIHVQVRQENDTQDLPIRKEPVLQEELYKFGQPIENNIAQSQSLTIVLAIDVSGSMEGRPLHDAQNAMISFVDQFEDMGTQIGVLAVSDRTEWVLKPKNDIELVKQALRKTAAGMTGWCNRAHPFDDIYDELSEGNGRRYAIVLADGCWSNPEKAVVAAEKCHQKGIEIAAVGFGTANQAFLQAISSQQDLSILTDQSALTQSFGKIAQSIATGGRSGHAGESKSTPTWETNESI